MLPKLVIAFFNGSACVDEHFIKKFIIISKNVEAGVQVLFKIFGDVFTVNVHFENFVNFENWLVLNEFLLIFGLPKDPNGNSEAEK